MQILRLVIERVLLSLLTLLIVSLIIFSMLEILPGDVATRILGRDATPETLAVLRERLHLDTPALLRYAQWLGNLVTGHLGHSLVSDRLITTILRPGS
jgi:ABC-type dipeptide/oligopeptide/nickel transport systems, permease components